MSPLYPFCCLLIVLSSFLVIGFALISWNQQDDCGCGFTRDDYVWGLPLKRESPDSYFSWQKILEYTGLDGSTLCDHDTNSHSWNYFEKRSFRLDDDELLLRSYCFAYKFIAEKALWIVPRPPDTNTFYGWISDFSTWITASVQTFSFERLLVAVQKIVESVTIQSKSWMDDLLYSHRDMDGLEITKNLMLAFFIWRMSGLIYHKQCWFSKGSTRGKPQMHLVSRDLMNAITPSYIVAELLKTCSNYHTFHLQSRSTNRPVYMKCLRSEAIKIAKLSLGREERILKSMKHRNIIRVVDWIATGSMQCLGLEYAQHGHLQMALSKHQGDFRMVEKIAVFRQVVRAVAYLHRAGFAHLNIRASSVSVFQKWSLVKLSGFCQATKVTRKGVSPIRILHQARPTSAPENELSDPLKVDTWALGALFLFILNGEAEPGNADSNYEKPSSVLQNDPKCPKGIKGLISGMMSKDPRRRPSAPAILSHLEKLEK